MDKLLRVENLNKDKILHQVSFEMKQGEMLAVMGPSGSGKSTLLYNVSGMDQPTGGKVWLGDTEITGLSEDAKADLRLHRMGFIFQQMNMIANLNILDNILLPVMQANKGKGKKTKSELMESAKRRMQQLSISELSSRQITQVSGTASTGVYLPEHNERAGNPICRRTHRECIISMIEVKKMIYWLYSDYYQLLSL